MHSDGICKCSNPQSRSRNDLEVKLVSVWLRKALIRMAAWFGSVGLGGGGGTVLTTLGLILALLYRLNGKIQEPKALLALLRRTGTPRGSSPPTAVGTLLGCEQGGKVNLPIAGPCLFPLMPISHPGGGMHQLAIGAFHEGVFFRGVLPVRIVGLELKGIAILGVVQRLAVDPHVVPFLVGIVFVALDAVQFHFGVKGYSCMLGRSCV